MPAQNLNIYGPVSSTLDFAVNCVYEYTKADGTKNNVRGITILIAAGAQFVYPHHNPDQAHADYIWKGWTGDSDVVNNIMPAHEVNLVGHFIAPDIDDGEKEDNARIEWRLPNYDGSNDPYDVYKFEYVPFGQALVAPENVPNYTGADGYTYQFNSWGTYPSTAPSSTDVLHIDGTSTRLTQQFNVKYYLYVYELGAADATKVLYKTIQVYPGTSMATVHAQAAADISTDYPDYLWKGVWYQQSFYADETTMGWFDRAYYSHIYSPEYAEETGVTVAGKHKVMYKTRSYAPGLAPDYTPYVDSVHTYKVADTQWVDEGATFTDPTGPFDAPFPNGSKFAFAGWEEHSNVMGTSDITVWASWSYVTYPCEIQWIIKTIDQYGAETEELYLVTVQQQGTALQWPADPTVPTDYIWAGWDVPTYPGMTNLVWREPVHEVYGKMINVNSGECPSGYARAKYLLKTHDTKYPPDRYITYQTLIAPCNGPIPQATGTPADWQGLDGNTYHFIEWVYPQSTMPYYGGGTVEIVAKDAMVATEKTFTMQLWYQGNGHNEKVTWDTIQLYPGTNLENAVTQYIAEHGEPSETGFVWSGIWRCDYTEMPNFDCTATTVMWDEQYYIDVHPESDEYFIIDWVSPYWKGYWRPQDRWTVKTEVVKQGTTIVPPADPVMPGGYDSQYSFIGWTGLPSDMIMPRRNLTITANWEENFVEAYVIWNMAIPQSNGTVSYEEYFRRKIDLSTARYTGAETAIGPWPSNPVSDYQKEFVQWCQPYSGTLPPSQWTPMEASDSYSIYYNPNNETQEYLIGTALMKSLEWDNGRLTGYSRVYWKIPSLIKHHTGYVEYEWTTWKFLYVKNGYAISTPTDTPPNVFDYEGYANEFIEWPTHPNTADGTDIEINAVYDRAAVRYTIRYYGIYYDSTGTTTANPSTKLLLTCRAFGGAYIDILPTKDPKDWEFHYNRRNIPVGSHFWGVINDSSGAPLFANWDGTCLWRDMDLAAELWLTGDPETADYLPVESVDLVEWPDGDDMDHNEQHQPQYESVTCTYMIGADTYRVKTYSDGTAFDNLNKDDIDDYLASHGLPDKMYDSWMGAPANGIVYVEDYPTKNFTVHLKYVDKIGNPEILTAPVGKQLTYNGTPQELIIGGTCKDGQMEYSLNENGDYSTTIPTATNAGDYTVWYRVRAINPAYTDIPPKTVTSTIAKAMATVISRPVANTDNLVFTYEEITLFTLGETDGHCEFSFSQTFTKYTDKPLYGGQYNDSSPIHGNIPKNVGFNAGTYHIEYTCISTDSNYNAPDVTGSADFTIRKYEPVLINPIAPSTAEQRTWDGNAKTLVTNDDGWVNIFNRPWIRGGSEQTSAFGTEGSLNQSTWYKLYSWRDSEGSNRYDYFNLTVTEPGTYRFYYRPDIIEWDSWLWDGFYDNNYTLPSPPSPVCYLDVDILRRQIEYTDCTAKTNLTYSATAQELVSPGRITIVAGIIGGRYVYSMTPDGTYTTTIPTATDAGTYNVYWKFEVTDKTHFYDDNANVVHSLTVEIAKREIVHPTGMVVQRKNGNNFYTFTGSNIQIWEPNWKTTLSDDDSVYGYSTTFETGSNIFGVYFDLYCSRTATGQFVKVEPNQALPSIFYELHAGQYTMYYKTAVRNSGIYDNYICRQNESSVYSVQCQINKQVVEPGSVTSASSGYIDISDPANDTDSKFHYNAQDQVLIDTSQVSDKVRVHYIHYYASRYGYSDDKVLIKDWSTDLPTGKKPSQYYTEFYYEIKPEFVQDYCFSDGSTTNRSWTYYLYSVILKADPEITVAPTLKMTDILTTTSTEHYHQIIQTGGQVGFHETGAVPNYVIYKGYGGMPTPMNDSLIYYKGTSMPTVSDIEPLFAGVYYGFDSTENFSSGYIFIGYFAVFNPPTPIHGLIENGQEQQLINENTHGLENYGFIFSYWVNDSYKSSVSKVTGINPGTYTVKYQLHNNNNVATFFSERYLTAEIKQATLASPTIVTDGKKFTINPGNVDSGTTTYYTTDGSNPVTNGQTYVNAVTLNNDFGQTVTIKAININRSEVSTITSVNYTVKCSKPVITNDGAGTYTVTCPDEGATLYYSTYKVSGSRIGGLSWKLRESNKSCYPGVLTIHMESNSLSTSQGYYSEGNPDFKIEAYAADASGNNASDTMIYKTYNL